MVKNRTVTIVVPESLAQRIEVVNKKDFESVVLNLVMEFFDDGRRKSIPTKRQGLSWQKEVYEAMMQHIGEGAISSFVRECVYDDLSKLEKDLVPNPEWKEGREAISSSRQRIPPPDRLSVMAPIVFPAQWIDRLEARWPGKVGPYIKAVTQLRLEKKLKREFPTQKGLASFLGK